jgi:hypothetical protein
MKHKDRNIDEDGYGDKDPVEPTQKISYKNQLPSDANSERLEETDTRKDTTTNNPIKPCS